jgi:hypothetical protein
MLHRLGLGVDVVRYSSGSRGCLGQLSRAFAWLSLADVSLYNMAR